MEEMIKKKRGIGIVITIWHGMKIQGLYCYLDMGNNTVTYHKRSHVPNLFMFVAKSCAMDTYRISKYIINLDMDLNNCHFVSRRTYTTIVRKQYSNTVRFSL